MRSVIALSVLGLSGGLVAGCARGAPPGFSKGTTWTFPLVDPLANGKLVTPVYLDGRGPYLMALDPDAPVSMVDREALPPAFAYRYRSRVIDEHDTSHPLADADVRDLRIGDLTISLRDVGVSLDHTFDAEGRRIYGIIGRDVIADSLVFGFDRERGIAWLQTQEAFQPAAGATVLAYHKGTPYTSGAVVRRLVTARVDGVPYELHLDLGETPNQLRQQHWSEAGLAPTYVEATLIDEVGTHRDIRAGAVAASVVAGGITASRQTFVPYDDRRWAYGQLEGTLGLDFFAGHAVAADWHHERYYLTPRVPNATTEAMRLGRWGAALPACAAAGCVTIEVAHPVERSPTELGIVPDHAAPADRALLNVRRDPAARGVALEVEVRTVEGFPPFYVHLPANVDSVTAYLEPRYAAASFVVTDVSPFPRACTGGNDCITGR
jgi:hypothetical protein